MRTKIMTCFIILILIVLVSAIVYIYTLSNLNLEQTESIYDEKEIYTNITAVVDYMTFADDYNVEGIVTVENNKECIEIMELEKNNNFDNILNIGKEFFVGDHLYDKSGAKVIFKNNLRLIEIIDKNQNVIEYKFLNYDNLCIEAEVDYENYKKIHQNTQVEVLFDGNIYEGRIVYIDYILSDNRVKILIDTCARYLPGTNVEVRFVYQDEKDFLCIPSEFITKQGDKYYVQLNMGTETEILLEDKTITIGNMFEIVEDGHVYTYYEVLKGLKAMDTIYMKVRVGDKIE